MKTPNSDTIIQNALVLSNLSAFAYAIVSNIGDQNISKTINGESLTRDRIEQLVATKLTTSIQASI